jgi:hypothetical protein
MFRLINLALALAASANVILMPSRLLSKLFVSDEAARDLDPFVNFLVETGINILLPAAVFLIGFCVAGFHKKAHRDMPPPPLALKTTWMVYCGWWWFPHILSSNERLGLGYLIAFGGWLLVLFAVFSYVVWVAASIVRELSDFKRSAAASNGAGLQFTHVASTALTLVLATIAILWFSPGKPIQASAMNKSLYDDLCRDVGGKLLDKPVAPVKSIAYDYDPKRISGWGSVLRVDVDKTGH